MWRKEGLEMLISEDDKKILKEFQKLTPRNKAIAQSNISAILAAQVNVEESPDKPKKGKKAEIARATA